MANNYGLFFARDGVVIRMPVNPEKPETQKENANDEYNVLGIGPVMVPRIPNLEKVTWEGLLPGRPGDPWVLTPNGFLEPEFYIRFFKSAMDDRVPILYTPVRYYEDGTPYMTSETGMQVLVTSFRYWEQGGETGDFYYSLELTEYRDYTPQLMQITEDGQTVQQSTPAVARAAGAATAQTAAPATAQTTASGAIRATISRSRQIPVGQLYVDAVVRVTGAAYASSVGELPIRQLSGYTGKIGRLITHDPERRYPVLILDEEGHQVGWVQKSQVQVVSQYAV